MGANWSQNINEGIAKASSDNEIPSTDTIACTRPLRYKKCQENVAIQGKPDDAIGDDNAAAAVADEEEEEVSPKKTSFASSKVFKLSQSNCILSSGCSVIVNKKKKKKLEHIPAQDDTIEPSDNNNSRKLKPSISPSNYYSYCADSDCSTVSISSCDLCKEDMMNQDEITSKFNFRKNLFLHYYKFQFQAKKVENFRQRCQMSKTVICQTGIEKMPDYEIDMNFNTEYCTLGSLCSRRSQATVKSRKVKGKRKGKKRISEKTFQGIVQGNTVKDSNSINTERPALVQVIDKEEHKGECSQDVRVFEGIINGKISGFLDISFQVGKDVKIIGGMVKQAFDLQKQFLATVSKSQKPSQSSLEGFLKPLSDKIAEIQAFREENRSSDFYNHLCAISEGIAALSWVNVSPSPANFVKEMRDAGQFYTNRVLKEFKDDDNRNHIEWAKTWIGILTELEDFIKQHHRTGLNWNSNDKEMITKTAWSPEQDLELLGKKFTEMLPKLTSKNDLFEEINQGESVTEGWKRVTADVQIRESSQLRRKNAVTVPAEGKSAKTNYFRQELTGKTWFVEHVEDNQDIQLDHVEPSQSVYIYRCANSRVTVRGKCNNIILDSCKKIFVVFDDLVSCVDFINCQSIQMQVIGKVPTIAIDKTDGCQIFLSKNSLDTFIITAKSSEVKVMIPVGEDFIEQDLPEQFKTTISGTELKTVPISV